MRSTRAAVCAVAPLVSSCGGESAAPQGTEVPPPTETLVASTTAPGPSSSTATTLAEPTSTVITPIAPPTTVEGPPATTATPSRLSGPVMLRGDGLSEARFGQEMAEVEQWLIGELGAPVWEIVARPPLVASQWYEAQNLFRSLTFEIGEPIGRPARHLRWCSGLLHAVSSSATGDLGLLSDVDVAAHDDCGNSRGGV